MTIAPWPTVGRFADITLARDSSIGSMTMGVYISAGVSFETARSDGDSDAATATPTGTVALASGDSGAQAVDGEYLAFGMRLGFH